MRLKRVITQLLKIEHKNLLINITRLKNKLKTVKTYFKKYLGFIIKMNKMEALKSDKNKCRHVR